MIRALHRWPGLLAAVLVCLLALSGAALSVFPAVETLAAPKTSEGLTVAELATRILAVRPGVEQIRRAPSGRITAYWFEGGTADAALIDPATGRAIAPADPVAAHRWLVNLHRSLFLGDGGRIVMAGGAAAALVLAITGAMLVARRVGGWRRWFAPARGAQSGRVHVAVGRLTVLGLLLSASTALWMTASTFDLLPEGAGAPPFPAEVSGATGMAPGAIALLQTLPVAELRELSFPAPGDATDVFTLKTTAGEGYIDQGSGALLGWVTPSGWQRVEETVYMLHTGAGAAALGLVLGLMALGVPLLAVTGGALWLARRALRPAIAGNRPAATARIVLLVGSEGGSTWGFAATLHRALTAAGQSVHAAPMAGFDPARYRQAEHFIVLAATYGDGQAPASARGFLERLEHVRPANAATLSVLGFGDRSFPDYCGFARTVDQVARRRDWAGLVAFDTVDRQSPQDFARWGRALGAALGIALDLAHQPARPATEVLTLISRRDHGAEVQAPSAILRFALPKVPLRRRLRGALTGQGFARFRAGDLLGIVPEGSVLPRFYSLASSRRDGFVEIVVRKQPGGLCSGQLMALMPGDTVMAFARRNPGFRPGRGRAPLILVGAGTGIGPLAGIVRANRARRPVHLFFGMRHSGSDFFYEPELGAWQTAGHLAQLRTAASRGARPRYVQDALRAEAAEVARLIRAGARVMVCGGRDMAAGVSAALAEILAPHGLTPVALKAEGRYVEDVY